jgi:hypothetical protein
MNIFVFVDYRQVFMAAKQNKTDGRKSFFIGPHILKIGF